MMNCFFGIKNSKMFSLDQYRKLLNELTSNGLIPTTDWNTKSSSKTLLLRHDVDFSVDFARKLAAVESDMGIYSTYFFMLTSNMYNLMSYEHQRLVKEIAKMGHKVSIHFDPTAHDVLEKFENEKTLFESVFGVEVDIVSIHRPGPFLDNNNVSLCGTPQTYNDAYFKKMKYLSDSGGRDVMPQLTEFLTGGRTQGLHLLIHPLWWVGRGKNATQTLNFWLQENLKFLTAEVRLNCKTYKG